MSKTLYLECFSGISGDMTVASLLDLGADEKVLKDVLSSIPCDGFDIKISRKNVSGIDACDFDVILDKDNHDHDMEYLFGHEQHHEEHEHHHHEEHEHHHHEEHEHHDDHSLHEHHHHEHRNLHDVMHVIDATKMTDNARRIAKRIFTIIAESEAKAHGRSIDEVHFHEVGAVDSIVDVISVAVCLDNLDIKECIVPVLYEGHGFVHCQHGDMPIPVPAVVNIASAHDIKLHRTDMEAELVTPTGAAIVAAICTQKMLPDSYRVDAVGIGAGKRSYKRPSMLRAMLIEPDEGRMASESPEEVIFKLESNIDDCSGEVLGYCMDKLLEAGARDVHYVPCYMKKNRPGCILNVICTEDMIPVMENIIFNETTTIGIRRVAMVRTTLERDNKIVSTSLGMAQVKSVILPNGNIRNYPEYKSVVELANNSKKTYIEVYNLIMQEMNV